MLKKIWKDPVISKVLAVALISLIGTVYLKISPKICTINFSTMISVLLAILSFILFGTAIYKIIQKINKSKILVYLSVGGTCRDPIAKVITEQLIIERGIDIKLKVEAMAVNDLSDLKVSYGAKYAVKSEYGQDLLSKHKCKVINKDIYDNADLILVMSQDVLKSLKLKFPTNNDKVYLLKEFFEMDGDIYNPWPDGHDEKTLKKYQNCLNEIKGILTPHFDKLINALSL